MKLSHLLPLAALASAIVVPDEQVLAEIPIEGHDHDHDHDHDQDHKVIEDLKHVVDGLKDRVDDLVHDTKNYLDEAIAIATDAGNRISHKIHANAFDIDSWLATALEDEPFHGHGFFEGPPSPGPFPPDHPPPPGGHFPWDHPPPPPPPPDHPPPGHSPGDRHPPTPPGHAPPGGEPPEHPPPPPSPPLPPHKGPRRHHPHQKSNLTIYQLIVDSNYTTKLAELIKDDEELVKVLNSTEANFTFFAPTDHAFEKIPKHAPKPPKELIKKVILYHILPSVYPAGRLFHTNTVPTLFNSSALGDRAQRLGVRFGFKGLTINYYSKVVAADIFTANGVIHGVDNILLPPPSVLSIVGLLPGEFSTLSLGLTKTGLLKELNETAHAGSTFFAPSNRAFQKLGPKINAFLFSKFGEKYLKALLQYHVVYNYTLYSDAFYNASGSSEGVSELEDQPWDGPHPPPPKGPKGPRPPHGPPKKGKGRHGPPPKREVHIDLPTLLADKSVGVDIAHFGPFTSIRVNGFSHVIVQDGIARDGVIHLVSDVLIPKKPGSKGDKGQKEHKLFWHGEEMSVEGFKERLEPYVAAGKTGKEAQEALEL